MKDFVIDENVGNVEDIDFIKQQDDSLQEIFRKKKKNFFSLSTFFPRKIFIAKNCWPIPLDYFIPRGQEGKLRGLIPHTPDPPLNIDEGNND